MIPTKRFSIEPWIEALVQNYGQQGKAKCLKGYILEAVELPSSHPRKDHAAALLLLSDGASSIPAILTKPAWEVIQEMEERDTVSGLKKCTTFLQVYSLEFQCEAEVSKSRFFLTVEKLATVAFGAVNDRVPCCTTLPAVKQKICETWRSLQGEDSSTTIGTQSGICLSDFFTAWFEDEMSSLLADLKTRLAPPAPSSSPPAAPQPSTSRAGPPPTEASGWRSDRARDKGQEAFTVPLAYLHIPAEQMEVMQRNPEGRGLEREPERPQEGDAPASPVELEGRDFPDSGQDGSSLAGSGEQEKGPANPWDMFASTVENLSTSSMEVSLVGSPMPDPPPDGQSPVLLDEDPAAVPMATSPPASPSERSSSGALFPSPGRSGPDPPAPTEGRPGGHTQGPRPRDPSSAGSSIPSLSTQISNGSGNQTLPPYQKPRPRDAWSCSPARGGSSLSFLDPSASDRRPCQRTSSPDPLPPAPVCEQEEEEEEGVVARKWRRARRKRWSSVTEADGGAEREGGGRRDGSPGRSPKRKASESGSPPSWLQHTQAAGRADERAPPGGGARGAEPRPDSATNTHRAITTHPDGTPFFYRYEPTPHVSEALSLFRVPDDLVRWSVRYLLGADGSQEPS